MSSLILYLLEASAALVVLYALYFLLLRNVTFFNLNRFFLLAIVVFSFLFPFVSFDFSASGGSAIDKPIAELSSIRMSYYEALDAWASQGRRSAAEPVSYLTTVSGRNWSTVIPVSIMIIYSIGVIAVLCRLVWAWSWIHRLRVSNPNIRIQGVRVVKVPYRIAPFSFLRSVFVCHDMLAKDEFAHILDHEKAHIQQGHSVDLIIVQLIAALLWFNPVVWWLIKSLKTTHEYIVDKQMINQGYSLVEYQALLLRQLISNNSYGLVHNFNLSFIKKRITMMTIQKSGWGGKAKVALALSAVVMFSLVIVQCNSRLEEQDALVAEQSIVGNAELTLPVLPTGGLGENSSYDLANSTTFVIAEDKLAIDGRPVELEAIKYVLEKAGTTENTIIVLKIDKAQPMGFVRDVSMELRKADRRKVLYMGSTAEGKSVKMPLLLSPPPGNNELPNITKEYAREHGIDVLWIHLGEDVRAENQGLVYGFVKDQIKKGDDGYVVSAKFSDDDTYGNYFINLFYVQEAFNQVYDERSQQMFGKRFFDLDRSVEEEDQQYNAVRKGIPRAISIAEKD